MIEDTATPETGPVDAPDVMDSVLTELTEGKPPADATEEVVAELVKGTEDEADPEKDADPEESATDPTDEAEEAEDAPQDEPETEPTDDPIYKVKANGEEIEVPLSELLNGYSRTADYKAKTMALADERRAVEAQKATVEQDVKLQYANELKQRVDELEALDPVLSEARLIDWNRLKAEDPATFVQYADAVEERRKLIAGYRAEIEKTQNEAMQKSQEQAQRELATRLDTAANKIVEEMPELATEEAFQRFATDNIGFLREAGFSQDEIVEALDDRVLRLADDARKWRSLQRAKQGLPAKKVVPKSQVKPMRSDASDSSRSSTGRIPPKANRDGRLNYVVNEFLKE